MLFYVLMGLGGSAAAIQALKPSHTLPPIGTKAKKK